MRNFIYYLLFLPYLIIMILLTGILIIPEILLYLGYYMCGHTEVFDSPIGLHCAFVGTFVDYIKGKE